VDSRVDRFVIEDWRHLGSGSATAGSSSQFFVIKVSGPRGVWPLKAYIMGPGVTDESVCTPQEDEIDLESADQAFVELDCVVEDSVAGRYTMRLYIAGTMCGEFAFVIRKS
jgi:hypothetical protein